MIITNIIAVVTRLINWVTRPRNVRLKVSLRIFTLSLLTLGGKGIFFGFQYGKLKFNLQIQDAGPGAILDYLLLLIMIVSFFIVSWEIIRDLKAQSRKKAIFIMNQGLDKTITNPLQAIIESKYRNVNTIKIDLIPYMKDRSVLLPEKALQETIRRIDHAKSSIGDSSSDDISFIYGGLAPVPLAYAAGYLFSNKNDIEVWDYDRDSRGKNCWYSLDKPSMVEVPFFSQEGIVSSEVCVVLPMSFPIDISLIKAKFNESAIFSAIPSKHSNDNMASYESQKQMQKRFRELLIDLKGKNVSSVHVFCAAQASFNFNMGRQIDGNHPQCIVYQYEPSQLDKYPWGIILNTVGSPEPSIFY